MSDKRDGQMPEFVVMYGDSPIGRLKCTADFVSVFSNRKRMELSGGFIMKPGTSPELVELFVSPIASSGKPTLTDAERKAVEAAVGRANRIDTEYAIIDAATLRGLLERLT